MNVHVESNNPALLVSEASPPSQDKAALSRYKY